MITTPNNIFPQFNQHDHSYPAKNCTWHHTPQHWCHNTTVTPSRWHYQLTNNSREISQRKRSPKTHNTYLGYCNNWEQRNSQTKHSNLVYIVIGKDHYISPRSQQPIATAANGHNIPYTTRLSFCCYQWCQFKCTYMPNAAAHLMFDYCQNAHLIQSSVICLTGVWFICLFVCLFCLYVCLFCLFRFCLFVNWALEDPVWQSCENFSSPNLIQPKCNHGYLLLNTCTKQSLRGHQYSRHTLVKLFQN